VSISKLRQLSLRQLLTIPYVALVLLAVATIGTMSYTTGRDAVDTLSDLLLKETVGRISQAVERHVAGSSAVLETAFPKGISAPASISTDIDELRTRFWLATSVHRDPHNYAYYGDRNGHFLGLWRYSDTEAELRLRLQSVGPRSIARFSGINGLLDVARQESNIFDPRERPWYKAGQSVKQHTWTSIYIDFKTLELVGTRARRVNDAAGDFQGVVATDLSLQALTDFLHQLKLSKNGFAFIVEPNGNLIAASRGPHLKKGPGGENQRLNAADSSDPLIVATHATVLGLMAQSDSATVARTAVFDGPGGEPVQVGYARVQDNAGLDWVIAVAVPRSDFLSGITANFKRTVWLSLLAAALIVATGFGVLALVTRDLRKLTQATRDVGDGVLDTPLLIERKDELGELAQSFSAMQKRLLTDRLTGLANREALARRVEDTLVRRRRNADAHLLALLFVDLDRFKAVNDTWGHDAGDEVLRTMGVRMVSALRTNDLVARYAGDEFVLLLDAVDKRDTVEKVRAKLEAVLSEPIEITVAGRAVAVHCGATIGVAIYPEDGRHLDTLIKRADADMYRRKDASPSRPAPV
jgi:diguanylate cyclase (GGDEF)-like protein